MIEKLETRYGTMFVPDTDNGQYWWLKTTGASPEDEMIELVCDMLRQQLGNGISIDCGANFGCWSLALAKVSSVHAFEPQRVIWEILCDTIGANPGVDINAWYHALGDEEGTTYFPLVDVNKTTNFGGISEKVAHPEQPDAPLIPVGVMRLDDIFGEKYQPPATIKPIRFIKIDCEGAEERILRGAIETIKRWKPIMVIEADHPLTDTNALGNQIQSFGYNVEILQDNNFIAMPV